MWRELLGLDKRPNNLVELIVPRRSFADVILPPETRQQLYEALTQIEKHRLIFANWGLGERHPTSRGLAFNFAGPPGTGKTICAEAVAYTLGKKLLRVRYAELESCWAGETGKNVRAVFRESRTQDAVLFFDEADSIAARRFANVSGGYEREANQVVNILLTELEEHEGVVIFATNMASNFDPAFERRIKTHVLFKIPNIAERERVWKVQIHPDKTPLGSDVDFHDLAERFEVSGGDIRTAVLKAAQIAAGEEGPDETKHILQKHFVLAMEQVLSGKGVMGQNINTREDPLETAMAQISQRFSGLDEDLVACQTELGMLAERQAELDAQTERGADKTEALTAVSEELKGGLQRLHNDLDAWREEQRGSIQRAEEGQGQTIRALVERLERQEARLEHQDARLTGVTLIPWPRAVTATVLGLLMMAGFVAGHFLW